MVIGLYCILKPPAPWFARFRLWIILAVVIAAAIFLSAFLNGIFSGGVNIDSAGISIVIHYAYWLLVFVITAYFFSQKGMLEIVSRVLAWAVFVLAALRWLEIIMYGSIGAWSGTRFFAQNTYGFLFSTFSPFLLIKFIEQKGLRRLIAGMGYLLLLGAAAINGSRGSWVAIAAGLGITLLALLVFKRQKFFQLSLALVIVSVVVSLTAALFPLAAETVLERYATFENLEKDKSYMIRQAMIQKALILFENSPIIGVGASRFTKTYAELDLSGTLSYGNEEVFNRKSAHNSYLDFLAETGLIGAVPFMILLIILTFKGSIITITGIRAKKWFLLAIFIGFVQMSIHMWAIATLTNTSNWFVYGLVAAMISRNSLKQVN